MGCVIPTADEIEERVRPYAKEGFSKEDWSGTSRNLAFKIDEDIALFEYVRDRYYRGHYFFKSKGKEAIRKAKIFLDMIYSAAEVVEGWTPEDNKPAIWMSRHLGFEDHGQLDTIVGPMRLFIMTRNKYEQSIRRQ